MKKLILASGSPRRRELLTLAGYDFDVITADADENSVSYSGDGEKYAVDIAALKNDAVVSAHPELKNAVILSADTSVLPPDGGMPLGKPADRAEAERMLKRLSGNEHKVVTGVVIRDMESGLTVSFTSVTQVKFRVLTDDDIKRYCDSGEPFDKAGAYGIQGKACSFAESISGDYFNVVGLPVCRCSVELGRFGIIPSL